jgi:hypothetical protein
MSYFQGERPTDTGFTTGLPRDISYDIVLPGEYFGNDNLNVEQPHERQSGAEEVALRAGQLTLRFGTHDGEPGKTYFPVDDRRF